MIHAPDHWHRWEIDSDTLMLSHPDWKTGQINVMSIGIAEETLDGIFQINAADWCTPEILRGLINALHDTFTNLDDVLSESTIENGRCVAIAREINYSTSLLLFFRFSEPNSNRKIERNNKVNVSNFESHLRQVGCEYCSAVDKPLYHAKFGSSLILCADCIQTSIIDLRHCTFCGWGDPPDHFKYHTPGGAPVCTYCAEKGVLGLPDEKVDCEQGESNYQSGTLRVEKDGATLYPDRKSEIGK